MTTSRRGLYPQRAAKGGIVTLLHLRTPGLVAYHLGSRAYWWGFPPPKHNPCSGSPQNPPPAQPPHFHASTPWPLGPTVGVHALEKKDTMHPCYAHMHHDMQLLQHTPRYAGIPMPLLKTSTHALAQECMMNSTHPGPGSENWVVQLSRPHCRSAVKGRQLCPTKARCYLQLGYS